VSDTKTEDSRDLIARCVIICGALLGLAWPAGAARILNAEVTTDDERYDVAFAVTLEGEQHRLMALLRDYSNMAELSPTMTESRVVRAADGERPARVALTFEACVFVFFCKTLTKVSDVHTGSEGNTITYVAVPELSDFHEARETITLAALPAGDTPRARFDYTAVLKPKFNVPPFVGPWLIRKRIIDDLEATARNAESMAQGDSVN